MAVNKAQRAFKYKSYNYISRILLGKSVWKLLDPVLENCRKFKQMNHQYLYEGIVKRTRTKLGRTLPVS